MQIAIGFKTHSGWATLVAVGLEGGQVRVVERCRIALVDEVWAKQPYHAAKRLQASEAEELVSRTVRDAHAVAVREFNAVLVRLELAGHTPASCSVIVGHPMPDWSVKEILAVHFRMHKAEGALFQHAILRAADACGIKTFPLLERELDESVENAWGEAARIIKLTVCSFAKTIGPPWGKDQRIAALAALIGIRRVRSFDPGTMVSLKNTLEES
jgi:hypothetical protein